MAARSTLITSQLPRAEWHVALGDPTIASEDVPHDLTDDVLVYPSQLLTVEALHRPLETTTDREPASLRSDHDALGQAMMVVWTG